MKKIIAIIGVVASLSGFAQQKQYKALSIAFYNVENLFHPDDDPNKQDEDFTPTGAYHYTDKVYRAKLHNIATVIAQLGTEITPAGPAIIGMAEVENGQVLSDLVAQPEIAARGYKYIWFYGPDVRGISTAMLYNPAYLKIITARPIRVHLDSIGQKRPTRDIIYVHGVLAGDTVNILVNHWPSRSGGESVTKPFREFAAAVDRRICDSLFAVDSTAKIIIMGDLNDNPTDASVIKVLQAKSEKTKTKLTDIYNPWINFFKNGYGTEYFESWNLLDQIMVSGTYISNKTPGWKYYKSVIFNKDFISESDPVKGKIPHRSFTINSQWDNGYSDHYPVINYFIHE